MKMFGLVIAVILSMAVAGLLKANDSARASSCVSIVSVSNHVSALSASLRSDSAAIQQAPSQAARLFAENRSLSDWNKLREYTRVTIYCPLAG